MFDNRLLKAALLGCTALALPVAAGAQTASTAPAGATLPVDSPARTAVHGVEEVVVTAQKRRESAQKVPISMRVISGATLTQAGITDIAGLQRLAPDLGLTTDTIYNKLSLRGVTAETIAEGADAALTVNTDGEYINRPVGLNATFYDLDRIEVLKGPQGTLYGRNSTAGSINIIDAKPVFGKYMGTVSAGYGNYNAFNTQAMINIPVTPDLAVRGAMLHTQHDGYRDNSVDGGTAGHLDDGNLTSGRVSAAYRHGPVDAYVAGEYVSIDQFAQATFGIPLTENLPGLVNDVPSQTTFNVDRSAFPLGQKGFFKSNQYNIRGHVSVDLGSGFDLTDTAGYLENHTSAYIPLTGSLPPQVSSSDPHQDSNDLSNELKLTYRRPNGLFIQGGFFYFNEVQNLESGITLPIAGNAFVNYFYRPDLKLNSYAGFLQADIPITSTIKLTGGYRYTADNKSALYYNFSGFAPVPPTLQEIADGAGVVLNQKYAANKSTYLGSIEWTPLVDHLLYAKVATGFRSGGFDNLTAQTINGVSVGNFAPETITDYEVGSKNRFLNGRVEYNLNAFHYDYTNEQISTFVNSAIGSATVNAGASQFWGIENDLTVAATNNDRLTLTVNYLDAHFTMFDTFVTTLGGAQLPVSLAGKSPPQAPRFTVAAGYNHIFDLGTSGTIDAGVYTRYKSHYFLTSFNFAADRQNGYTQTDVTLGYTTANGRYSLQAYGRNLENNIPIVYSSYTGGPFNTFNYIFGTPRTYGFQGTVKF